MTNAITKIGNMGSVSFRIGTITVTTVIATETVDTGMTTVVFMVVTLAQTAAASTTVPMVETVLPAAGDAIVVNFPQGGADPRTYTWFAIGYP